jgi:hypothetical protein
MKTTTLSAFEAPRTTTQAELRERAPVHRATSQFLAGQPSSQERMMQLQLDGYQVALVPLEKQPPVATEKSQRDGNRPILLLPLTWQELISYFRTDGNESRPPDRTNVGRTGIVEFGQVRIDFSSMETRRCERLVVLTAMEFKVLRFFVCNPNRVISREELLNEVWGYNYYPCTRTVDNHVLRLRQKLEKKFAEPVHFQTVHGFGYRFVF